MADGGMSIEVYPYATDNSTLESTPSTTPFFSAVYRPISYLPSFPMSTGAARYMGMDLSIVQPPLPSGNGAFGELPGTDRWCQVLPSVYSRKTSLGWWDLKQRGASEEDALLGRAVVGNRDNDTSKEGYENWWPGFGRWRIGIKMEDAIIDFPEGKHWSELKL